MKANELRIGNWVYGGSDKEEIEDVIEITLTDDEMAKLKHSAAAVEELKTFHVNWTICSCQ